MFVKPRSTKVRGRSKPTSAWFLVVAGVLVFVILLQRYTAHTESILSAREAKSSAVQGQNNNTSSSISYPLPYELASNEDTNKVRRVIAAQRSALENNDLKRALMFASNQFQRYSPDDYSLVIEDQYPELSQTETAMYLPMEISANKLTAVQPLTVNSFNIVSSTVTYILVRQKEGWRVDCILLGNLYAPSLGPNPYSIYSIPDNSPEAMGFPQR